MKNRKSIGLCVLLTLSVLGCGPIITFNKYVPPDLPKSELATLQVDTTGSWIQQTAMLEVKIDLIEMQIDKKLAVRKKIKDNKNISIDDIYVAPGTHTLSVRGITYHLSDHPLSKKGRFYIHSAITLSVELKADRTYTVKVNLDPDIIGVLSIEIFDKKTGEVVSRGEIAP